MRSITFNELRVARSSFPSELRADLESICGGDSAVGASNRHQNFPGERALDAFFETELATRGYTQQRNVRVTNDSKFDIDLLITRSDWRVAVSVQGGKAARVDLDLIKLIAFTRASPWSGSTYGALIFSDKRLLPSITGTGTERAFDYVRRLCPLFYAIEPDITDLLVVEFDTISTVPIAS